MSNYFDAVEPISIQVVFVSFVLFVSCVVGYLFYCLARPRKVSFVVTLLTFVSICVMLVEFVRFIKVASWRGNIWAGDFPRFDFTPDAVEDWWCRVLPTFVLTSVSFWEAWFMDSPTPKWRLVMTPVWFFLFFPVFSWSEGYVWSFLCLFAFVVRNVIIYFLRDSVWEPIKRLVCTFYFVIDDYYYGALVFDDVLGAIQLPERRSDWNHVSMLDGNPSRNAARWRWCVAKGRRKIDARSFVGRTVVGGVVLPYAVGCDPATLVRFRDRCAHDIVLWKMFVTGVYDLDVLDPSPLYHLYTAQLLEILFPDRLVLDYIPTLVLYGILGTKSMLFHDFGQFVSYVMVEEAFNEYSRFPIVLVESIQAFWVGGVAAVGVKVLIHGILQVLPLPLRVVVHCLWNSAVVAYSRDSGPVVGEGASSRRVQLGPSGEEKLEVDEWLMETYSRVYKASMEVDLKLLSDGAKIVQVAGMVFKREWSLLGLEMIHQWADFFRDVKASEIGDLIAEFFLDSTALGLVFGRSGGRIELLSSDGTPHSPRFSRISALVGWLPSTIARSPTVAAMIALVTAYALKVDPTDLGWLGTFARNLAVPDEAVDSAEALARQAVTVGYAVWDAAFQKGSLKDRALAFFGTAKHIKFVREAAELQGATLNTISEHVAWIDRAESFLREWSEDHKKPPPGMESMFSAIFSRLPNVVRARDELELTSLLSRWFASRAENGAGLRAKLLIGVSIEELVKRRFENQPPPKFLNSYHSYCNEFARLQSSKGMVRRPEPFVIFMMGDPGTGKTFGLVPTLTSLVPEMNRLLGHCGLPTTTPQDAAASVTSISFEKKHALAGNVFSGNLCLLANDIPANTSDSAKSDKLDLAVYYQQVIDNAPLYLSAPEIEQKRVSHLPLISYNTSNNMEFLCAGETDKLRRRFDEAVMLYSWYCGPNGTPVNVEDLSHLSREERRAMLRYTVCKFHASGKRFWFTKTEQVFGYSVLTAYIRSKYAEYVDKVIDAMRLFGEGAEQCACGKTYADHLFREAKSSTVEFRVVRGLCGMLPREEDRERVALVEEPFGEKAGGTALISHLVAAYPFSPGLLFSMGLWAIWTVLIIHLVKHSREIGRGLAQLASENASELVERLLAFGETYPLLFSALTYPFPESERLVIRAYAQAYERFARVRKAIKRWLAPLLLASSALALAGLALSTRAPAQKKKEEDKGRSTPLAVQYVTSSSRLSVPSFLETADLSADPERARDYRGLAVDTKALGWKTYEWDRSLPVFRKQGVSEESLVACAEKTTLPVTLSWPTGDGKRQVLKCLLVWVAPNWVGFNKHFVRSLPAGVTATIVHDGGHKGSHPFQLNFQREDLRSYEKSEFFFLNQMPASFPAALSQLSFWCDDPGEQMVTVVYPVQAEGYFCMETIDGEEVKVLRFPGNQEPGSCGTPVIARQTAGERKGGHFIVGHVSARAISADGTYVLASVANRRLFDGFSQGLAPLGVRFDVVDLPDGVLPVNSSLNGMHTGTVACMLGSDGANGSTFKSSIVPTAALPFIRDELDDEYAPPSRSDVKGGMVDGVYLSPVTHATAAGGHPPCDARPTEREESVNHLVGGFTQAFRSEFGPDYAVRPATLDEAVRGVPGFFDGIDMSKSVGPFFRSTGIPSRYDVFEDLEIDEGVVDPATMRITPVGEERMRAILDEIDERRLFCGVTEWKAKDEVRPVSKLKNKKVRLFCVLDFAFGLLSRAYLIPLITLWLRYPEATECYGAMNAGGPQAHRLHERLGVHPNFFDADFKVFDGSHGSFAFLTGFEGVYKIAREVGYTHMEALRAAFFVMCAAYCVLKYGKDFALKAFGFPSGHIATLFFNSFINSILMRVVYRRLVGDLAGFHRHVVTANVGDDNVSSVADEIAEKFNMLTYSDEVYRLGYVVTPAKKDGVVRKFIGQNDVVFLKRTWYYHPLAQAYVLALAPTSIWKAFGWHSTSSSITPSEKILQVGVGAQVEAWLHGPEFFATFQEKLIKMFKELRFPPPRLLDSDELLARWKASELRSWAM